MNIILIESKIQFKNPNIGQPTRAIPEHYNGRRVLAYIDGEERMFRFNKNQLPFYSTEEDIIAAIQNIINNEKNE